MSMAKVYEPPDNRLSCAKCGLEGADANVGGWWIHSDCKPHVTALRAALDQERADNERLRAFAREFFGRHWNIRSYAIPDVRRLAAKHGLINNVDDAMPTELIRIGGALLSGRGEAS